MFAAIYGRAPTGLFIPANLAPEFIATCDDAEASRTGEHTIPPGVVLESFLGMRIRLCTGLQIGVGTIRDDDSTPPHTAIYTD